MQMPWKWLKVSLFRIRNCHFRCRPGDPLVSTYHTIIYFHAIFFALVEYYKLSATKDGSSAQSMNSNNITEMVASLRRGETPGQPDSQSSSASSYFIDVRQSDQFGAVKSVQRAAPGKTYQQEPVVAGSSCCVPPPIPRLLHPSSLMLQRENARLGIHQSSFPTTCKRSDMWNLLFLFFL